MSQFEKRVQLNKIIESQLPEFLVVDFPKAVEFFKQYYISQEFQGGNIDLVDNLDRYIKLDNLVPEVVIGKTTLSSAINTDDSVITVASTKGFPDEYGLLKIGDEIITYTEKTTTTFTGCIRGFSGITGYDDTSIGNFSNVNRQSVIFEDTKADSHETGETVQNLSALFLQEFYKKLKRTFTPGLEEETFVEGLDVGNFIKHARSFYQSKGIEESVIILFKVLYGVEAKVLDLENRLIKPSSAEYIRREQVAVEVLSGNPFKLEGQTVYRSNDLETNAAVSEVEIFTRDDQTFYNFGLFVGYNDRDLIEGKFEITPFTRALEDRSPTDNIITVDSTIGFAQTGHIIANNRVIYYSSKSVNQFFGCTGISTTSGIGTSIDKTSPVRSNETVFGYEDGDLTKPVHFRITGVLKDFESIDDIPLMEEDEIISVKNVGEVINNPTQDKTYKETFANSWIYNTSTRFAIDEINGATFTLKTDIDKSQLKKGDTIEVLIGDSNNRATQNLGIVDSINNTTKEVVFSGLTNFTPNPNLTYSIRRILVKADTSGVELKDGRNKYLSNVLNVYTDDKSQFGYVASNSLPGYSIQDQIVESSIPDGTVNNLGGYSNYFKNYSTIKFPQDVKFIDGDQIRYTAENQLSGLVSGDYYYIKKVTDSEIKLYISLSLLQDDMTGNDFVRFGPNTNTSGAHNFTLTRHEDRVLSPNSILRKFPLSPPQSLPVDDLRGLGNVGILIDGTEISSPESTDSVYYGPLESFDVLNGGKDYDVLNPPEITITTENATGSGAKVEPTIIGSVKEVFVDPQPFDIDNVESVSIKGGNGSGAVLQPVVGARFREIEFDSRPLALGGGVDIVNEIIRFKEPHFLTNGETIIYNQNGNEPIALGPAYDGNQTIEGELVSGDEYVVRVINTSSVKLFKTAGEALSGVAGINTLGLAVPVGTSGIHKFRTVSKKNLRQIKVIESGSGYTHRKLKVKNVGFSTEYNTISFKNHGFKTGEIVNYTYSTFSGVSTTTDLSVVGLSSDKQYHVHKLDDDKFKLIEIADPVNVEYSAPSAEEIYRRMGLETYTSTHNAPILFTQATDDPTGNGNQALWLRDYVNDIKGIPGNATATLEEVGGTSHAAFTVNTTLQTAIRTAVGSTNPSGTITGPTPFTIIPTDGETHTVDGTSYPVMGRLYVPTSLSASSIDVIVAFHGTVSSGTIGDAATTTLQQLTNQSGLNLRDKIIFSAAYPQDHIPKARQFELDGVGTEAQSFLMGDNLPYARAAVGWAQNSLNAYIAAQGGSKTIGDVYLFGHSQGGKLVSKINTLDTGIAGVVANAPGPIQFDQTCSAVPDNYSCSKIAAIYGSVPNPDKVSGNENIDKKKFVDIVGFGTDALNPRGGYQIFQYPPIEVDVNVSYANTTGGTFTITPLITGEITDAYLYETGSGYGTETLNLHTKPLLDVSEGKGAQLNPIITNGRIQVIQILNKGSGYLSLPDLVVEDTSATPGTGAILKPVITNGQLTDVVVLNGGLGYSSNSTTIYVKSRGFGAKFDARVRRLNVNDAFRFAEASRSNPNVKIFSNLYKNRKVDNLVYGIFGYSQDLGSNFEKLDGSHSPIIGWAYDGNPIYGPFGYSDPVDIQSGVRIINPSYELQSNRVVDRPVGLGAGFFIDDYRYTGSGDLDRHNGRYCRTPEFPNGVYAYFVGVTTSVVTGELEPLYPYVIGNTYNSQIITDNFNLDQSFDFNNSDLVRNTLPYNVAKDGADYDFLNESYEKYQQLGVVDAVTQGVVDEIRVIDGGEGYRIDDTVNFNLTESGGAGLRGSVSELIGIGVTLISTTKQSFEGVILEWDNDRQVSAYNLDRGLGFPFNEKDTVLVSGLSTSLAALNSSFQVGIKSETVGLAGTMTSYVSNPGGIYEDIFLSTKFNTVSVGSTLVVSSEFGNEILTVLNNYNNGVLRVHRFGTAGYAHTIGSELRLQPNRITLPVRTKEFKSDRVDKVFFNALHSVGIGTTPGGSVQKSFTIGNVTETVSIPFNQIYIPGHPFKTGERVIFRRSNKPGVNSILVGEDNTPNNNFFVPNTTTLESELYVINKGPNYIGLVTTAQLTTSGQGLYFHTSGSDDAQYSLENIKTQVTADIDRLVTQVSCAATHGLINRDKIRMNVVPNGTVGIGTSTHIRVKFNENDKKLLINPVGITSSDISIVTNQITINNHGYKTGDKVYYESSEVAAGLHTGSYYVIEDTRSKIRLAETLYDTNPDNETSVNIVGTGDTHHTFSLVNPRIEVIRNNALKFDLTDESLDGYKFNIYTDSEFINEYISSYDSREFNVVGLGTVGIGTTGEASVTLNYSKNIPTKLFYNLEKSGYITTADNSVNSFNEIEYIDSPYNGSYNVFGIGSTTFKFSPVKLPENLTYLSEDCEKLEYSTKSSSAINGSIGKISLVSEGFNFSRLPKFEDVTSTDGVNANLVAISTSIGRIKKVRFRSIGYDYTGDKTLRPEAMVAPIVAIDNLDIIENIDIEFGGKNYLSDPKLILWDDTNKRIVNDDMFEATAPYGAVAEVKQLGPIFGLKSEPHKLIAVNNSNGVGISSMITSQAGIATCTLTTPILGFTTSLFAPGDNIFVEGVQMDTSGDGYNSEDYEYKFFKVIDYINSSPAILTFSLEGNDGIGFTTNPGTAKIFQSGYATIVNKKNYPVINIVQNRSPFTINEGLSVDVGTGYFPTDLTVSMVRDDYIKVSGNYTLKAGSKIRGVVSGTVADVTDVTRKRAKLNIDYASRVNTGWRDDIGKVSEDYQVTSDNDYHQNLSYSVQSPITWDEFSSPVNSVIHPAGMKNFADVGITSSAPAVGIGTTLQSVAIVVLDIVGERRVDIINNFDNAVDVDPLDSQFGSFLQSNQLQIENTKLASFTECRTNRVLIHDDISDKFSSRGFQDLFSEIEVINDSENHVRYLIQIVDPDTDAVQLSELIYQSNGDGTNAFLFEKYSSFSDRKLGNFSTDIDSKGRKTLIFTPTDPYNTDHDIKILKRTFQFESLPAGNTGFGTESFGSINLTGSFVSGITSVGSVGIQTSIKTIATFDATDFNAAFASIEIIDALNREDANYIEAVLDFDGSNTYLSEYYFDTTTQSYSAVQTGVLDVDYDSSANVISLKAKNTGISTTVSYDVRSNIVGFGTTASGIGTYRFLVNRQPAGTEISARLESTNNVGTSTIRVAQFDIESISSSASIVRVAAGQSSAVHQVAILANDEENFTTVIPGPFAPVNNTTGLGTFSGEVSGTNFYLNFHPDAGYQDVETQALNEVFYREMDFDNQSRPLEYGPIDQNLLLTAYDGLNGLRANRTSFDLTHEGKPIYVKKFDPNITSGNPANETIVNYTTGVIQMKDHFFNTGEELIYTPVSTFTGIGASAMGIGQTANYLGIVTDRLPERVYPIALTPNTFQLATKEEYARAGIFVTFTDAGLGNSHELEFTKKLTKTVIGLDGIVQQPINFTPIAHTLLHNSGSIGVGINTFNLSGIASVQARDLIRIDDEYMKVVEVGFSTNAGGQLLGPINGVIAAGTAATFSTVSVERGSVGSAITSHTDGTEARVYRGSINIVKNKVHFIDPPKGNSRARRNESNLPYVTAEFSGRTFLRQNYATNMIFDDISDSFTGIAKTYTNKISGLNTVGIEPGNGILFINGVFQTPTTENNVGQNYIFQNDSVNGISSVVFTGITSTDGTQIESEFDINQNQIPRGGLIVSLGSTPGLGYAPLVGAQVIAKKNSSGELTEIVGINTYLNPVAISTADYDRNSGIMEIETSSPHYLKGGDSVRLIGLGFTCTLGSSTYTYPDHNRPLEIFNIIDRTKLNVVVGPSTVDHFYVGGGTVNEHFKCNTGSGYRNPVSIGITDIEYEHRFSRALVNGVTDNTSATHTVTDASYIPHTGVLQLTIPDHGLTVSNTITITDNSIFFRCEDDSFFTEQPYPRSTDPVSGVSTTITAVTSDTITVNVGRGGGGGNGAVVSAQVGAGGTLAFSIDNPGTGYINPQIIVPQPNYENMEVVGVSRLGIGETTECGRNLLVNLEIAQTTENKTGDRFFDASNLIEANVDFIADIAYGRMLAQFPSYTPPVGTTSRDCKDDIVDVLEAMAYNLKFGGNDLTVDAANLYITGAHVQGEEDQTIYAFDQAKEMAVQAMRNETITTGGYTARTQFKDVTITIDSNTPYCANVASAIHTLVGIVTRAVDPNIGTIPTRTIAPGALYNVSNFKIARNGYAFAPGDVVKVVGLVTAKGFTEPVEDFKLEITQTFNDFFSAWSFGEMDYIDSIAAYQDGIRTRFPIYYENNLLSFELDPASDLSSAINLDAVLVIFINGVLQTPGYSYSFDGGTSFIFSRPPKINDRIDIFFYVGTQGVDVGITTVKETLKVGDDLFLRKHPDFASTVDHLTNRTIREIVGSDTLETPTYIGPGIDSNTFRPFDWIKQKTDKFINGDIIPKTRPILEPLIFPTAKVIGNIETNSTEIFVDNAQFFDFDEIAYGYKQNTFTFDAFIVDGEADPQAAEFSVSVSAGGTVNAITVVNPGLGYTGSSLPVAIAAPKHIGVGVGTTAIATATVSAGGTISSVTITDPGFGYTSTNPPNSIIEVPSATTQSVFNSLNVQGFAGIITGIAPATGSNGETAIKFMYNGFRDYLREGETDNASNVQALVAGYPVYIFDTVVGNGVTSIYSSDNDVVGIGTTHLDNVYIVDSATSAGTAPGEIICNVHSGSNLAGIAATGNWDDNNAGLTTALGYISWGRIYNFNPRTNPLAIGVTGYTVNSGLTTFPTIQRRGDFGEFNTGAVLANKPRASNSSNDLYVDNNLIFYP